MRLSFATELDYSAKSFPSLTPFLASFEAAVGDGFQLRSLLSRLVLQGQPFGVVHRLWMLSAKSAGGPFPPLDALYADALRNMLETRGDDTAIERLVGGSLAGRNAERSGEVQTKVLACIEKELRAAVEFNPERSAFLSAIVREVCVEMLLIIRFLIWRSLKWSCQNVM